MARRTARKWIRSAADQKAVDAGYYFDVAAAEADKRLTEALNRAREADSQVSGTSTTPSCFRSRRKAQAWSSTQPPNCGSSMNSRSATTRTGTPSNSES